jgi:hypothetical protein
LVAEKGSMSQFTAFLHVPAADRTADNYLMVDCIKDCDRAGLRVEEITCVLNSFSLGAPKIRALRIAVVGDCPIIDATEDEIETHIQNQFNLNGCNIDASIDNILTGE